MNENKSPGVDGIVPKILKETLEQMCMPLSHVICKLLETIIRDHMMDFLIKHKSINPSQHGFLKARSCLTNLLCFC